MWKAFKEFAFKGNVFDLAVAVIIGAAFGKIVTALVESVIMPLVAATVGAPKVSEMGFIIGGDGSTTNPGTLIPIGLFFQAVIDFLIVAIILFMIVQGINRVKRKQEAEVPSAPEPSEEILLLREIRDSLKRPQA